LKTTKLAWPRHLRRLGQLWLGGAAFTLPSIAAALGFLTAGQVNWRLAIALTGIAAACYGVIYYFNVTDTPPGKVYQRPPSSAGMEVTSQRDFWFLLATNIPLVGVLGLIAWRLTKVGFIGSQALVVIGVLLVGLYLFQAYNIWQANKPLMTGAKRYAPEERYNFPRCLTSKWPTWPALALS
jgi:NNP family nitrate/nitrite transporter-like MFS transporter